MELTKRQEEIMSIVKGNGPITSEQIAERLSLTRATLRPDLAILTMAGLLDARPRVGYFFSGKTPNRLVAQKIKRVLIGEIKSLPVVVKDDCSAHNAIVNMFLEDCGTLFVVSNSNLLQGVVSRKDLLKSALGGKDLNSIPVGVVMTRMPNVVTVEPEETLWEAAKKMATHEIDALPVVRRVRMDDGSEGFEVVGRVSKSNVTRLFVELGEGL
ncbi:MAG: helix-turn-helix transcriptional regulator [Eubacteriales bacterium]|nr:helix-turn-helix transcriptional regulator [Eubacteriales bacterium]MDZ4043008.1 helix-turn-helix transcriptional regulator [Eubacteriales bacterium]MDZ7610349.1 helix-turn-helix transcriptional regulator [Eubacteriales bacterium]